MSALDFNIMDYEASGIEFSALPSGQYVARIVEANLRLTKNAIYNNTTERYLNIQFKIDSGVFSGRIVWDKLNIFNSNIEAQDIGRRRLRAIAKIGNIEEVLEKTKDTSCLVGCVIGIVVGTEEYNGSLKNKIKSYKDIKSVSETHTLIPDMPSSSTNGSPREFQDDIPF
jgi:Protein of unknown function (DUF669).